MENFPVIVCNYRCTFCDNDRHGYRAKSPEPQKICDSECCTYGRWFLIGYEDVENPSWDTIKTCYKGHGLES